MTNDKPHVPVPESELRQKFFASERGQNALDQVRSNAIEMIQLTGAFRAFAPFRGVNFGDTFRAMDILNTLVQEKVIKEVTGSDVFGQDRIFVAGENF